MLEFCSLTLTDLQKWLTDIGEKPFRALQIFDWVYKKKVLSFQGMSNLSKELRASLEAAFLLPTLKLVRTLDSADQETKKFLWELADGKLVESVLIGSPGRMTVCVSSQVGCPAKCAFCASGKEGFFRNLSVAEIIEQVLLIDQQLGQTSERVSHVVFMGMGEPLENYTSVVSAVKALTDPNMLGLSQRRITISTVGVVDNIRKLAEEETKVNLVLSLHAPNQHIRKKIIPYARRYDLPDILVAMDYYFQKTKRDITFEYTLIAGINDSPEHADELADLLQGKQCTVNLIPYNPVVGLRLNRPSKEGIEEFRQRLLDRKIPTTWRYTKGKDIAAACGQLALQKKEENRLELAGSHS